MNEVDNTGGRRLSWLFLMAWRDSRRNRSRLFLFMSSIILGIAALVAIYSLGDDLQKNVDIQAAELLGADLEISDNRPAGPKVKKLLDSIGGKQSQEQSFASMIYFLKNGGTRLAQIRALQGEFPYYGELETIPVEAAGTFRENRDALVDQTLMLQYSASVGDSIKLGDLTFRIAGTLLKAPGQTGIAASVAPSVYIPLKYLEATELSQKGSRILYRYYFRFAAATDVEKLVKVIEPRLRLEDLNHRTVESQKADTGRSFQNLTRFLGLIGFVALLLGCVGVASAIHIYIREKLPSIATLRCLGARLSDTFFIFLIQITGIGLLGSMAGAALGVLIQQFLPAILKDLLPFELVTSVSFPSVVQGVMLGTAISVLFALPPLLSVRKITPLDVLRSSFDAPASGFDFWKYVVYVCILLSIFAFTWFQMKKWLDALIFTGSITFAFLLLVGMALALIWFVRKFFPSSWGYLGRQGLANLFRPNNQTVILIVSVGLGTMLICTLLFVQKILLNQIKLSTDGDQPNMVLFDIQQGQSKEVSDMVLKENLPVLQLVPIVNMRLDRFNKLTASAVQRDTSANQFRGLFSREYRVTFRDSLTSSEKITAGSWQGEFKVRSGLVPVSIEEGYAKRNHIKVGDTLVFNVQGSMLESKVGSLREVNWSGIQTNFLVVFPKGVLEEAPQFHVLLTHVPDQAASARFQQETVRNFPNVSIVDLGLVLRVVDEISTKIGFVVRFMAGFSILTGIIVLIASVLISKYQRMRESVLLRTLGASRRQIFVITSLEYFFLGALAALTGVLLSLVAGWGLARFSFETEFVFDFLPLIVVFLSVTALTVIIGLVNSVGVLSSSPLEVLRRES